VLVVVPHHPERRSLPSERSWNTMASFPIRFTMLALAALVPLAVACGDDPTDPDPDPDPAFGMVDAIVHDSSAVLPEGQTDPAPTDSINYDGILSGTALIEIYSDANGWVALGSTEQVSFAIFCEEAAVVTGDAAVEVDSYTQVRLTLTDFEASVIAGAVVGGITYNSDFVVALGNGDPVVIEKSVSGFAVADGATTELIFDLNTEVWLDADIITAGVASAADVSAATNVIIR
jgi:hypothetical protein